MVLQNQHSEVLSVDVARHMNFSKPSVCHAVKQLKGKGFLDVYEDGSRYERIGFFHAVFYYRERTDCTVLTRSFQ